MKGSLQCSECGCTLTAESGSGLCLRCESNAATLATLPDAGGILIERPSDQPEQGSDSPTLFDTPSASRKIGALSQDRLRDYELLQELGRGGMGVVFKARQISLNRVVAIKMILAGEFAGETEIKRFHSEAEAAAHLDHPNIVSIYEIGEQDGRHFFSMKVIEGDSLSKLNPKLQNDPRSAVRLLAKIARAVHYAHQRGILHRDLKPGNILVDAQGEPHVTDFGLATRLQSESNLTLSGAILGTPSYMSPEQAVGQTKRLTTGTDVYSLGSIFYHMLAGHPPFVEESSFKVLQRVIEEEAPPLHNLVPRIDRDLETICLKCLEKDPVRRYGSAEALAEDLERWLRLEPILARPGGKWEAVEKWVRRKPVIAGLLGALMIVAAIGLAGVISQWRRAEHNANESRQRLVGLNVLNGVRLVKEGDPAGALVWYAEALRLGDKGEPQEAIHRIRIGSLLQRVPQLRHVWFHEEPVWLAQLSPRENRLAIISGKEAIANRFSGAELRVWDFPNGATSSPPISFSGGRPQMYRIRYQAFSPDGQKVVTVRAHDAPENKVVSEILVMEASTGKEVLRPLKLEGLATHVEFSSNGEFLVAAGKGGIARVWDMSKGGEPVGDFAHKAWVTSASFSPDNTRLLTGSRDKTAKLWDFRNGAEVSRWEHKRLVLDAQFSHDGKRVVTAASDQSGGEFRVWDAATGAQICFLDNGEGKSEGILYQASFSPDDRQIAVANFNGTVTVWDAVTGRMVLAPFKHNHGVLTAEFAPDGHRILSASFDTTARLWMTDSGGSQQAVLNQCSFVLGASFTKDGQQIVTASTDGMVRRWELPREPRDVITLIHSNEILHAEFSHDGEKVLTASADRTARVWASHTGQPLFPPLSHQGAVYHATFSPDDRLIVTASADGSARIWDAANGRQIGSDLQHSNTVWHAEFDAASKRVITASGQFRRAAAASSSLLRDFSTPQNPQSNADGMARVWDARTGAPTGPPLLHKDAVVYAGFAPDDTVITASADRTAQLWRLPDGAKVGTAMPHKGIVFRAVTSPDGKWIATVTGGEGSLVKGAAQLWEAKTGAPGRVFEHGDIVYSAAFSRDGKRLVTASEDATARVWDVNTGEPLTPPMVNGTIILGAGFSPDGRFVLTTSEDGVARLWDAANGGLIAQVRSHEQRLNATCFSPDGTRILTAGDDGKARITVLPHDDSRLEDLILLAQVLSARRIDSQGAELEPLGEREFENAWTKLSKRFPDRFGFSRPPK